MDSPLDAPSKTNAIHPKRLSVIVKNGLFIKKKFLPPSLSANLMGILPFKTLWN